MKLNVLPLPEGFEENTGIFSVTAKTPFEVCPEAKEAAKLLSRLLEKKINGFPAEERDDAPVIFEADASAAEEGYFIDCTESSLKIRASAPAGFLYAVQTLRQLLGADVGDKADFLNMDCVSVYDKPACRWRGFMLDIARHFFGTEEIKRILDLMALCKLNVFHFHFADDQGYRIESKAFPKLNEIGSKRADTQIGGWKSEKYRGAGHEGFLTQKQVKEIVDYAAALNITVVPELDFPGHFSAILAAYPEYSCTGENVPVRSSFGVFDVIACAGKQSTYDFLFKLIDEICETFPAPYFHIGGDEAPKKMWKACPHCQKVIAEKGLKDEDALQAHMTNVVADYLSKKGKKTICWYSGPLEEMHPDIIAQYWAYIKNGDIAKEVGKGRKVIASKCSDVYLDYPYSSISLKKIYESDPYLKEFSSSAENWKDNVLGIEAPLWTEWVYDREKIDFNCFPRLCALAEVGWTKKSDRGYKAFVKRLLRFELILDALDVNYAKLKLAEAKNYFTRVNDFRLWTNSDQYSEVRRNREKN